MDKILIYAEKQYVEKAKNLLDTISIFPTKDGKFICWFKCITVLM